MTCGTVMRCSDLQVKQVLQAKPHSARPCSHWRSSNTVLLKASTPCLVFSLQDVVPKIARRNTDRDLPSPSSARPISLFVLVKALLQGGSQQALSNIRLAQLNIDLFQHCNITNISLNSLVLEGFETSDMEALSKALSRFQFGLM